MVRDRGDAVLGMFETVAVVLCSGTGSSDLAPLCAIDEAMHPQQQANYHKVTSLIPSAALVYRIKPGAPMVRLDGAHVPAVLRWKTGRDEQDVCAGIGIGLPSDGQTGVIYHDAGRYGPQECKEMLHAMVASAMELRGVQDWTFYSDVAWSQPDPENPLAWRAALASLVFLDRPLLRFYQDCDALVPLSSDREVMMPAGASW